MFRRFSIIAAMAFVSALMAVPPAQAQTVSANRPVIALNGHNRGIVNAPQDALIEIQLDEDKNSTAQWQILNARGSGLKLIGLEHSSYQTPAGAVQGTFKATFLVTGKGSAQLFFVRSLPVSLVDSHGNPPVPADTFTVEIVGR
jgi:hypothetical protein